MAFYNKLNDSSNIVISFSPNPKMDFAIFAKGYFAAAKQLCDELFNKNNFPDYYGYPIIFLYRHSLELHLKSIIYKSALATAFKRMEDFDNILYNHHNLTHLSNKVTLLLEKIFPDDQDLQSVCNEINEIAREFAEIDPNSFSYRYPIDKNGNYSTKEHQTVNLRAIYCSMNGVLNKLETINFGLNLEMDKSQEVYDEIEEFFKEIELDIEL